MTWEKLRIPNLKVGDKLYFRKRSELRGIYLPTGMEIVDYTEPAYPTEMEQQVVPSTKYRPVVVTAIGQYDRFEQFRRIYIDCSINPEVLDDWAFSEFMFYKSKNIRHISNDLKIFL